MKKSYLTKDEVTVLVAEAQEGSEEAQAKLLKNYKGTISKIVKKYLNKGHDYEDLYQVGAIGFLKGIQRFDSEYGVYVATFIQPTIQGEIQRFLRDNGPMRISRPIKELVPKLIQQDLVDETPERISEVLALDNMRLIKDTIKYIKEGGVLSLDKPLDDGEGNETSQVDLLSHDLNGDMWLDKIALKEALQFLDEKYLKIIHLRYYKGLSQKEVGVELGHSQMHISRLERRAIKKLREIMKEDDSMARQAKGDKDYAIELLKDTDMTFKEISDASGVPLGSVGNWAKKHRPEAVSAKNRKKAVERASEANKERRKEAKEDFTLKEVPAISTKQVQNDEEGIVLGDIKIKHLEMPDRGGIMMTKAEPDTDSAAQEKVLDDMNKYEKVALATPEPDPNVFVGLSALAADPTPKKVPSGTIDRSFSFRTEASAEHVTRGAAIENLQEAINLLKLLDNIDYVDFSVKVVSR